MARSAPRLWSYSRMAGTVRKTRGRPVVYVEWEDIASPCDGAWRSGEDLYGWAQETERFTFRAAGMLLAKTKKYLVLSLFEDTRQDQFGPPARIPLGCVKRIKRLM